MRSSARGGPGRGTRWWLDLWVALGLAMGGLASGVARAGAQTGVIPPHQPPADVRTYRTVEECLVAVDRVIVETLGGGFSIGWVMSKGRSSSKWLPLPDTVRVTAARCAARYAAADTALKAYPMGWLLRLWLTAHRDADATALVAERLAALPVANSALKADSVLEDFELEMMSAYIAASRPAEARKLLEEQLRRETNLKKRLQAHENLIRFFQELGDTAPVRAHFLAIVAEVERFARTAPERRGTGGHLLGALVTLAHRELLDSFVQSKASYQVLYAKLEERSGIEPGTSFPKPLPLVGDFWFGRDTGVSGGGSLGPRPTPGNGRRGVPTATTGPPNKGGCGDGEAMHGVFPSLRTLARRFPELEITLVTRNYGVFGGTLQSDSTEAEWLWRWLHDWRQLPGALLVLRAAPTFRLPLPDGRYLPVRQSPPDFGKDNPLNISDGGAYLVDRDGEIVAGAYPFPGNNPEDREEFLEWIDAALRQRSTVSAGGPAPHP